MAIPSLAEAKQAVAAQEIAVYEEAITTHLEQAGTVDFLEDETQANRVVIRTFPGRVLSELGLEALVASIEAAGWTEVEVVNTTEPPRQGIGSSGAPARPMVSVSFRPAGATPPVTDPETNETP